MVYTNAVCVCIDGQKIAIQLSRRINVVSKQLKLNLEKYNAGLSPMQQQWKYFYIYRYSTISKAVGSPTASQTIQGRGRNYQG